MLNSRRACATGSIAVTLTQDILAHALTLGFDIAGIIPAGPPRHGAAFGDWLAAGFHGEMSYLAARAAERADPTLFAPDAQSMILVAATYAASNTGSGEEGTSSHPSPSSHPEPVEGCELTKGVRLPSRKAASPATPAGRTITMSSSQSFTRSMRSSGHGQGGRRWARSSSIPRRCSNATSRSRPGWASSAATAV